MNKKYNQKYYRLLIRWIKLPSENKIKIKESMEYYWNKPFQYKSETINFINTIMKNFGLK